MPGPSRPPAARLSTTRSPRPRRPPPIRRPPRSRTSRCVRWARPTGPVLCDLRLPDAEVDRAPAEPSTENGILNSAEGDIVTAIPLGPVHPRHGTHEPTAGTPERTPGSVRRTATTDMLRPEGLSGPLVLLGRARDLVTRADGAGRVVADASSRVRIDFTGGRVVEEIETTPARPALAALVGTRAASGFRTAALAADPALPEENGLLNLLVDDIPVTTLVSGHAWGAGTPVERRLPVVTMRSHLIRDQCAGFADGATIMAEVDRPGIPPLVTGPAALPLMNADADAWHPTGPLPPHGMRRSRR